METQKYTNRNIRDFVRQLVDPKARETPSFAFCTVTLVDKVNKTIDCEAINEDKTEFVNVMLSAEANDSFSIYPAVDSTVLIMFTSFLKLVILIEEVESLVCDIDKNHFEMDKDKFLINNNDTIIQLDKNGDIVLNDGSFDGIPILNKIQANLDSIKSYLDTLKAAISTGINAVGVSTAASGTVGATAFDTAMLTAIINFEDMENTKIKHGI